MQYSKLPNANLTGKRVLLRAGFDVPIEDGKVCDTTRIDAMMPTIRFILDAGGSLILMAHQGRPKGKPNPEFSQKPLVPVLEKLLGVTVQFAEECNGGDAKAIAASLAPGEVLLLENLRFVEGEKSSDLSQRNTLGQELASLADVYVNDAFTNCHRDHASMTSVPRFMKEKYIGLNVQKEIEGLSKAIESPAKPVTLIISGLKMETKIPVIRQFLDRGDDILVGGGVANTMLASNGNDMKHSKVDDDFIAVASEILEAGLIDTNANIHLPSDGVWADSPEGDPHQSTIDEAADDAIMFDIGSHTLEEYSAIIDASQTIVWNGPMGMYESEGFSAGTKGIAAAVQRATDRGAITIIGGGDTLDFHERYGQSLDTYTFVSTAGGAMLDFISGKTLPALEALLVH